MLGNTEDIYDVFEMGISSGGKWAAPSDNTDIPFLMVVYMLPSASPLKATPWWTLSPLNAAHEWWQSGCVYLWIFACAQPCFLHALVCLCVCLCYHSRPEYPLETLHAADMGCEKSGIECCPNATALICYLKREWLLMKFNQTSDYLNWAR